MKRIKRNASVMMPINLSGTRNWLSKLRTKSEELRVFPSDGGVRGG